MKRDCEGEAPARSITASFDSTKPLSDASRNGSLAAESQKLQQLEQQREQKTLKEAEERQRAEERKQRTRIGEKKKKRKASEKKKKERKASREGTGQRDCALFWNQKNLEKLQSEEQKKVQEKIKLEE